MLQGFAAAGDPRNAASLSDEMVSSGVDMDVVSYGIAVDACAKAGDVNGALKLIKVQSVFRDKILAKVFAIDFRDPFCRTWPVKQVCDVFDVDWDVLPEHKVAADADKM